MSMAASIADDRAVKISVVIPTYNRAQFVRKAIDSVLNQSLASYEIIVIDDGSTDGTRATLAGYAGKISYIYQKNSGVSSARNKGIKQARGDWVAFLDSDDEWTREYLFAQGIRTREFPNAVAHITNAVTINLDGTRTSLFEQTQLLQRFGAALLLTLERPLRLIVEHAPWFLQSTILRRDILMKIGPFDEKFWIGEDLDVIARAALMGPFTICKEEMVEVYRRVETMPNLSALSLQNRIYRYQSYENIYLKLLGAGELTATERITIARALSKARRSLGNVLVLANRKTEARRHYGQSLIVYPSLGALIKFVATFLPGRAAQVLATKGRDLLPRLFRRT